MQTASPIQHAAKFALLSLGITSLPLASLLAWDSTGHRLVAEIAYSHLTPTTKQVVDKLSQLNAEVEKPCGEQAPSCDFVDQAPWMDTLPDRGITLYKTWHYVDEPLSLDGSPVPEDIQFPSTDNAAWAVGALQQVLANSHSLPQEKALYLNFLVHIVADLHQPLHTVTGYSQTHPNGDRGGNAYRIQSQSKSSTNNLHSLWDKGAGVFAMGFDHYPLNREEIRLRAKDIEKDCLMPSATLAISAHHLDSEDPQWAHTAYDWAIQGRELARSVAYNTPENQAVSPSYLSEAQQTAKCQVALAGYHLATLLNKTFEEKT